VLFEKSRWRQAENILIRQGGQVSIEPVDPEAPYILQDSRIAPQ
jgi:hypothetical protein